MMPPVLTGGIISFHDRKSSMTVTIEELENRFEINLQEYASATSIMREQRKSKLLSQVELLTQNAEGFDVLYRHLPQLLDAGIFAETPWEQPQHLVPALVGGTLLSGYPNAAMEILSELRLLAIAEGDAGMTGFTAEQANAFLKDLLVKHFDLAMEDFSEEAWDAYSKRTTRGIRLLFDRLLASIPLSELKDRLHTELKTLAAQRPIVQTRMLDILRIIDQNLALDPTDAIDASLLKYVNAAIHPTPAAARETTPAHYRRFLTQTSPEQLVKEATTMGESMMHTSLVSTQHVSLLQYLAETNQMALMVSALSLNAHGSAELERHREIVYQLITNYITHANPQSIFGLARVLQRNLFSRRITRNALIRLLKIEIHPEIARSLRKGNLTRYRATPIQILVSGILSVLGHPLGVRQGNNPTCQSARAISMWSRHAPGKLINLLIDAATTNNIILRYEGDLLESKHIHAGLIRQFDYKLDPVSVVLVPHLDMIYNEMMRRAAGKHFGKDPHVSVNPAFYGHWIQTGFKSVYNPTLAAIDNYKEFVRTFYASFHPEFNGGYHMVYPVPIGIFITDSKANMLGFHAISLLRVETSPHDDEFRAYFFNPNSEGKQNWGQDITPTVSGFGEKPGESSLPFGEFCSRVYAYHYNQLQVGEKTGHIPSTAIQQTEKLAKESWGRNYNWIDKA